MIEATRRWLRRNRTKFAIGFGVVGVGYLAGQYVLSKINEARERMATERTAKENLRRRFQQNQEDCTITILELLPSVTEAILEALPAEQISKDIQQKNAEKTGKLAAAPSEAIPSDFSSGTPSVTDEDGRSMTSFRSESYVHASQMGSSSTGSTDRTAKTKVQLWNELKITSITRAFTLIYSVALLNLLTRIQLNLLGRKNYLASVIALSSHAQHDPTISLENNDYGSLERAYGNDFEINRKYLTFSWWLMHRGRRDIVSSVEAAVKEVFGPIKPSEELDIQRLSSLILDVRRKVEGTTPEERRTREWLHYLLPPREQEDFVLRESGVTASAQQNPSTIPSPPASPESVKSATSTPALRRLLDETADLIDSPLFTHVLTLLLDTAFSQLTDQRIRSEAFKAKGPTGKDSSERDEDDEDSTLGTAKLASIMAVMTREARAIGSGVPNEYVQAMDGVGELEGFAAVVYSENLDAEAEATIAGAAGVSAPKVGYAAGSDSPLNKTLDSSSSALETAQTTSSSGQPNNSGGGGGGGIANAAAGYMDAAWVGFESVWGKVSGNGGGS